MASEIRRDYRDRPLSVIGVLTGSLMVMADLIRSLDLPLRVGFVQASSYRGTTPGPLRINPDFMPDVENRDVVLVDDIFDTGHTIEKLVAQLQQAGARSVRTAVLLRKLGRQEVAMTPHYVAFEIPNEFVVGYGLDYNDGYRELPYVAVLEEADIQSGRAT
jgi:hypoxanthine phosphoribosyltransferase